MAEARILVRPDTTKFRAELEAALSAATAKPITIPVAPVVVGGITAATTETNAFAAAQLEGAAATKVVATSLEQETVAATQATVAQRAHAVATSQATKGVVAQGASLLGLRAGTLAASTGFIGATVAVLAFAKAVQSAATLETELNVFQVTAGATADQMARVSDEAKALGKDLTLPGVTANDAAVALTELSKAGLSVQDSLDGARGALQLATAAQIDNVTATKLVAGALNAFNLSGTEAVRVADLLTGAAKESQGEIGDMGTALSQVASVSQQFGVSIGDTVTLLTELAQAGLSGGRAGTSLRVAFLRLINPTAAAQKELDKLNIAVRDANGNLKPTVFTEITDALQGYSKAQRDAALATIFGSDAIRSAAIIGNKGALAFLQTSAAVNEVGLAQEQAAARTKGLQGDTENLKNQISSLGLTLGQVAAGPASLFVKGLAGIASETNIAAEGVVQLGTKIGKLGGSIGGSIPFIDRFGSHIGTLAKLGLLVNPLAQAIAIAAESEKLLGVESDKAKPKTDAYGNSIDGVGAALSDLSKNLLQSAADSKAFTQQVTTDTANLLQSAADSRIGSNVGKNLPPPPQFPVQRIQNIVQGFSDKELRDKINHDNASLLADLKAEQDFLVKELQKQGVKNRPALRRALESALGGVVNEIDSINAQAQSKVDAASQKAQQAAKDAAAAAKAQQAALVAQAKAQIDLRNSTLDLAIQAAGLTPGKADDKKAINAKIKALQGDITGLEAIRKKTLEQKQKIVDLKSAVLSLRSSLQSLVSSSSGGFSLKDLFNEALNQFQTFGSNISGRSGVLSGQDARASFGQSVASQIGSAQLTEAQKQTVILEQIQANTSPNVTARRVGKKLVGISVGDARGGFGASVDAATFQFGAN